MKKAAQYVMEKLNNCGYEAYMVGGCVRDMLMGRQCHDIDVTTNALPHDVKNVFEGERVIETGLKHGTVTVLVDKNPIEITTFRKESIYSDGRHPDSVEFVTNICDDLARRDFTMNAIAMDKSGKITDCFGGKEDIDSGIIRCVGDPDERFKEDSLRILRGIRFACVLGFEVEENTKKAMYQNKEALKNVSAERKATELCKLAVGEFAGKNIYEFSGVLEEILPGIEEMKGFEQNHPYHIYDVLRHICAVVDNVPQEKEVRIAALLHDFGKPTCHTRDDCGIDHFRGHSEKSEEIARKILCDLKFDKKTRDNVCRLVKYHDYYAETSTKTIKRALKIFGNDIFKLFDLRKGDILGQNPMYNYRLDDIEKAEATARKIIDEEQCFCVKDLAINGSDIVLMGAHGKQVGETLDFLLENVICEKIPNEREALLRLAKEKIESERI